MRKMKKTVKLFPLFLLVFFLGCNLNMAQNKYYIEKKLVFKSGMALNLQDTDFGIKSNSSQSIFVNLYDKLLLDSENIDKKDAFLYGFKSTGNTGEAYQNIGFVVDVYYLAPSSFGPVPIFSSRTTLNQYSNNLKIFKERIFNTYSNDSEIDGVTTMHLDNKFSDKTKDVVVEIILEPGTSLSNVLGIKLPGIENDIVGVDFTPTTFAFIGNYGCAASQGALDVSILVKNKIKPDVIISAGNDSYHNISSGACGNGYVSNTGVLYQNWITTNRFKSVLGNMDYENGSGQHLGQTGAQAWKTYFNNNSLNYSFVYGDKIEFFMINTNNTVGPGTNPVNNVELHTVKTWLTNALAASQKQYKIVVGHHAPYASGQTSSVLQSWNFREMGADMYISSGPDFYERHDVNGIPYVNIGLGGFAKNTTDYTANYPATMVKNTHYADKFGALKATVGGNNIRFEFLTTNDQKIDEFYIFGWEKSNYANNYYLEKLRGTPISSNTESIDVYLILGQSNASGRCGWLCFRDFTDSYSGELPNSYLLNEKNEFEHAKNSFARYSSVEKYVFNSGLGVGWSFAKTLNEAMPNKKLGFISNARGGVETEQWFPDYLLKPNEYYGETSIGYTPGNNLYREAKKRFIAMKNIYPNANLKGVIWMQGESDAKKINTEDYNYFQRTKDLIQLFRSDPDYNSPNLKFLIPEVSKRDAAAYGDWAHTKLNEQINALHNPTNNIYVTNVEGLTTFDEIKVHWDIASYNELGIRLANLIIPNQNPRLAASEISPKSNYIESITPYNDLRIYPNPSKNGDFTIEFGLEQEGLAELEIVNFSGLLVYNKKYVNLEKGNHKLHLQKGDTNLSSGIYIVKLITQEFTETLKLVVD